MPSSTNHVLAAAIDYFHRGWRPLPVVAGEKRPIGGGWTEGNPTLDDVRREFSTKRNVGILLGEPSGGLVDVDIDHATLLGLTHYLPVTDRVHGRPSNPASHYWYKVAGAVPSSMKLSDPVTGDTLIELRSTGGQTVVPPSWYGNSEHSETLEWSRAGEPAMIDGTTLVNAVRRMAGIGLLVNHWPGEGSRNDAAMALGGALLKAGWPEEQVEELILQVAETAQDEEAESRVATVSYTAEKLKAGTPATGFSTLRELIDERVLRKAFEWLDVSVKTDPFAEPPILFAQQKMPEIAADVLPEPFRGMAASLATSAEVPVGMVVMTMLGVVSACVAKRFVVRPRSGWQEPVNLYTLIALPPGTNKTLVLSKCMAPVNLWEISLGLQMEEPIRLAKSERRNLEARIAALRARGAREKDEVKRTEMLAEVTSLEGDLKDPPVSPKIYINDVTPETLSRVVAEQGGRVAIISDEGGVMETMSGLYSQGRANPDVLLKGIDGGTVRLERKDRTLDINPYLTMLLVVQPAVIQSIGAQRAFHGRGLLERFLYLLPESTLGYRTLNTPPVPDEVSNAYMDAVKGLLDIPEVRDTRLNLDQPREIILSPEAYDSLLEFRGYLEEEMRPSGRLREISGWVGKLAGFSCRIAGLLTIMRDGVNAAQVDCPTMDTAISVCRSLIEHALAAFSVMTVDKATTDAMAILNWALGAGIGRFKRTDCYRKFHGRFKSVREFDAALSVLVERNILSAANHEVTTQGKRATIYYSVHPALVEGG